MKVAIQLPAENSWGFVSMPFDARFRFSNPKGNEWAVLESLHPLDPLDPTEDLPILHKGFFDSHLHLAWLGRYEESLDFSHFSSLEDFADAFRNPPPTTQKILQAHGWDESRFGFELSDFVSKMIKRLPEHQPLIYFRICGHSAFINKKAQDLLGLSFPSRFVQGTELAKLWEHIPNPTEEEYRRHLKAVQDRLVSLGISGVGDMALDESTLAALRRCAEAGELFVDVQGVYLAGAAPSLELSGPIKFSNRQTVGPWDRPAQVSVRHWKKFLDGSFGSRSAWLSLPYADAESFGTSLISDRELLIQAREALANGFFISFHAIGDSALDQALLVGDKLRSMMRSEMDAQSSGCDFPSRHRLEHVQLARPDQVKKLAQQDLWTLALQPGHRLSDKNFSMLRLGRERLRDQAYRLKTFVDSKIPIALSSDAPIGGFDPLTVIKSTLQESFLPGEKSEALNWAQAVWFYSTGARRSLGLDPGKIGPGSTVFLSNAAQ